LQPVSTTVLTRSGAIANNPMPEYAFRHSFSLPSSRLYPAFHPCLIGILCHLDLPMVVPRHSLSMRPALAFN
jgi:hypothetical protein